VAVNAASTTDYFSHDDHADLRLTTGQSFTFVAWVYATTFGAGPVAILNKGLEYALNISNEAATFRQVVFQFSTPDGKFFQVFSPSSFPSNQWVMLRGYYDATRQIAGLAVGAGAPSEVSFSSIAPPATDQDFLIGAFPSGGGGTYWRGRIDEVTRWDRLLTPDEVEWLLQNDLWNGAILYFKAASGNPIEDETPETDPGDIPTALHVEIDDENEVDLAWCINAIGPGNWHEVFRSVDGGAFAKLGNASPGESTFHDGTADTTLHEYTYKVRARNKNGSSDFSDAVATEEESTVLADDFNRANGSLGAEWTEEIGNFGVVSNQAWALDEGFSRNTAVHVTPLDGVDQSVRIKATIVASAFPGVVFRYTDDASGHYVVDWSGASLWWSYYPDIAGTARNIINSASITFTSGDYLGITVIGTGAATRVRIWLDTTAAAPDAGGETWDGLAPDINQLVDGGPYADTGTKVGITQWWNSPSGNAQIDDFAAGTF
jgi:hypothetical protein